MFIVSLKVGAIVSKCFPSKRNLFWASLAFFGNACLGLLPAQICPAALPAWISSWLNLEPHLPVRGDRICGVMLHCPWWSRDTTRAALGMERFPVFPRKNGKVGGGRGRKRENKPKLRWQGAQDVWFLLPSHSLRLFSPESLRCGDLRATGTPHSHFQGPSDPCVYQSADQINDTFYVCVPLLFERV